LKYLLLILCCEYIFQMIWVALRLCEIWEAGMVFVPEARLKELEELYSKCYVFLAIVLSNLADNDTMSHCEYSTVYLFFQQNLDASHLRFCTEICLNILRHLKCLT
jgi:hypothetical protein